MRHIKLFITKNRSKIQTIFFSGKLVLINKLKCLKNSFFENVIYQLLQQRASIADQYTFEVGTMMYQHSKQALPPCISSFVSPFSSIHNRRTQSTTKNDLYKCIFLNSPFCDAKSLSNTKAPRLECYSHQHKRSKFQ